jgi:hypothetical protein
MSKKGDLEISETLVVFLLLIGMIAAVWVATGEGGYNESAQVKVTDESVGELLNDGLAVLTQEFYEETEEGNYTITVDRWALGEMDEPPDSIPVGTIAVPAYPVLFNGRFLENIRGLGVKTYERTDVAEPQDIKVVAIFLEGSDTVDKYYEDNEEFHMKYYTYSTERRYMEGCNVNSFFSSMTANGTLLKTYYIECNLVWHGPY